MHCRGTLFFKGAYPEEKESRKNERNKIMDTKIIARSVATGIFKPWNLKPTQGTWKNKQVTREPLRGWVTGGPGHSAGTGGHELRGEDQRSVLWRWRPSAPLRHRHLGMSPWRVRQSRRGGSMTVQAQGQESLRTEHWMLQTVLPPYFKMLRPMLVSCKKKPKFIPLGSYLGVGRKHHQNNSCPEPLQALLFHNPGKVWRKQVRPGSVTRDKIES